MFRNQFTVTVPQSCHEDWNNMTTKEHGRFCHSCQKTVADFTQMSDIELREWLAKQKGNDCGRFRDDQLNRVLYQPAQHTNKWALRTLMLGMATWLGLKTSEAHQFPDAAATEVHMYPGKLATMSFSEKPAATDSVTVQGVVLHAKDKSPLPEALIFLEGTDLRTNTDSTGSFSITLPVSTEQQKLVVALIGMKNQAFAVSSLQNKKDFKVMLEDDFEALNSTITLGGYIVKYKWYTPKGIKQRIHNLFH